MFQEKDKIFYIHGHFWLTEVPHLVLLRENGFKYNVDMKSLFNFSKFLEKIISMDFFGTTDTQDPSVRCY